MDKVTEMFVTVAGLLVTVALLAVFLSKNSNTSGVISSFFQGFNASLGTAVSPITGGGGVSLPQMSGFGGMMIR